MTTTLAIPPGQARQIIGDAIKRLSRLFRVHLDTPEAVNYIQALEDLPPSLVERAVERAIKTQVRMPPPAVIRQMAEVIFADDQRAAQTMARSADERHIVCWDCQDTGWRPHVCTTESRCGRYPCNVSEASFTHRYVAVCECRATNAAYQRNHPMLTKAPS